MVMLGRLFSMFVRKPTQRLLEGRASGRRGGAVGVTGVR